MQRLNYALPDYPELSFSTQIERLMYYHLKNATIKAKGPIRAIKLWRRDLERWCAEQGNYALMNKVDRSGYSDSAFVTFGRSPEVLVAFIVKWLGQEWLERTLLDSPPNTPSAADLKSILDRLATIEGSLFRDFQQTVAVDYSIWAAGKACHGTPVQTLSKLKSELTWYEAPTRQPAEPD